VAPPNSPPSEPSGVATKALPANEEMEKLRLECAQLRQEKENLEGRLRDAEHLAAQRDQTLRSVIDEFQQFAYAASHDLQEPLRGITSYVQLLKRPFQAGNPQTSDAETAEFLGYIEHNSTRMTALVQDLLAYSRVPQTPRRSLVNLEGVVEGVRLKLYKELAESGATLTRDELPEMLGNEALWLQLFTHLVSNSIKFRSADPPAIHIAAAEQENETIISVRDNGQGIAPQFHAQVFGVFKRLHGHDIPGTGIGLAICQKIARSSGGRIWVESDGKTGSTFSVALPH
jgi:two-component system, chemotaxis family, sensor kinase Cph1